MESFTNSFMVSAYVAYLVTSVGITIWVARTLYKSGRVFLQEAFAGKETLADSVNHLLVVGFYLINIGFVSLALKENREIFNVQNAIELVCTKVGWVLVVLGVMHFFNLYIFNRFRKRGQLRNEPPPISPREFVSAPPANDVVGAALSQAVARRG